MSLPEACTHSLIDTVISICLYATHLNIVEVHHAVDVDLGAGGGVQTRVVTHALAGEPEAAAHALLQ